MMFCLFEINNAINDVLTTDDNWILFEFVYLKIQLISEQCIIMLRQGHFY